jgi:type IV secretory pathway TrbF-like protein
LARERLNLVWCRVRNDFEEALNQFAENLSGFAETVRELIPKHSVYRRHHVLRDYAFNQPDGSSDENRTGSAVVAASCGASSSNYIKVSENP